jgi:hypothetical protein
VELDRKRQEELVAYVRAQLAATGESLEAPSF